jgi:two-component system chemotaxis sensor kinase CheA
VDEDILQDFLAEAQDLLEQLNEQLVDLEQAPNDIELLNAIFRAFHTIKGGAGFIGIKPLVEVCHRAENVFDKIRNGEMTYTPEVADIILQVYDTITDMINRLQEGEREFEDVDPDLLARLDALVKGGSAAAADSGEQYSESSDQIGSASAETSAVAEVPLELPEDWDPDDDITDEEFELLLQMREQKLAAGEVGADDDNKALAEVPLELPEGWDPDEDITDEEFEQLLKMREEKLSQSSESAEDSTTEEKSGAEVAEHKSVPASPSSNPVPQQGEDKPMSADKPQNAKPKAEPAAKSESTVRVDTKRLDEIMNLVGELVLVRNRLLTLRNGQEVDLEEISNAVSNLDHVTTDLQAAVMKTRMQPVKKVFGRFPRVVRDLARKLGKQIELELRGEDTDLDKNLVEALADPLVHLVRNSVDHGIETPEERIKAGKPPVGHIILAAEQEGDHILLSITDDGRGMDPEKLKRKAIEKGLIDEMTAAQMSDKEAFELIMAAGFSTAETISDISGRGVGMDVVKSMITRLNGSIEIDSVPGQGTQIKIRVPLTLAILPTLMVAFGEDSYSIPLTSVQEIFDYNPDETNRIDGQMMVQLRERSIPLYFLQEWLAPDIEPHIEGNEAERDKVVIVNVGGQRVGLVVQQVKGQEEVVIKPLGVMLQKVAGYAGATITGNGSIALILDLPGVLQRHKQMH